MYLIVAKHEDADYYEEVDSAESEEYAEYLMAEYQLAFGNQWDITYIRPNEQ